LVAGEFVTDGLLVPTSGIKGAEYGGFGRTMLDDGSETDETDAIWTSWN